MWSIPNGSLKSDDGKGNAVVGMAGAIVKKYNQRGESVSHRDALEELLAMVDGESRHPALCMGTYNELGKSL